LEQQLSPGEVISEAQANTTDQESIMAISKRTRFEVLRRDNHTCRYCRSVENPLTVDHVVAVSLGGSDAPENLVAACRDCNAGKASSTADNAIVAEISDKAVRWAAAMRLASERIAAQRKEEDAYCLAFLDEWDKRSWYTPHDWRGSLVQIRNAGLPINEVLDAADIALCARNVDDRWRYFCGVAWKKVNRLQEQALAVIAEQEPAEELIDLHHLLCYVIEGTYAKEAVCHRLEPWLAA
jgi:hypothetical protein